MAATMELITISRMKAARRCLRFHYFDYEIGRRPIKTGEALFFGTLFHVGLEQWWLGWKDRQAQFRDSPEIDWKVALPPEDILANCIGAMQLKFAGSAEDADASPFDLIKAEELMRGYHYRWIDDMEVIEVIDVESQFVMPMVNPLTGRPSQTYQLGGKVDVRVRMQDGTCRTIEHKTSTEIIEPGAVYWTRLRMDGQVSQYQDGARFLGDDVAGCIYDVVRRPTQVPAQATPEEEKKYTKKASTLKDGTKRPAGSLHANQREADETPEEYRERVGNDIADDPNKYYQRADVVRLEDEMNEFRFDTWELAKTVRERQLAARTLGRMAWPRNPDGCFKWSRACEYFAVCTGAASIDDDHLFCDKGSQHSELEVG